MPIAVAAAFADRRTRLAVAAALGAHAIGDGTQSCSDPSPLTGGASRHRRKSGEGEEQRSSVLLTVGGSDLR
jgi:hypothetical protein